MIRKRPSQASSGSQYQNFNWQQHHFFQLKNHVPKHKKVTYGWVVDEIKSHKEENHCVRLTVGGNRLNFGGMTATQCASMST